MNINRFNLKILTCLMIFVVFLNLSCVFAYETNDSFIEYETKMESEESLLKNENENIMSSQHSLNDGGGVLWIFKILLMLPSLVIRLF